MDEKMIVNLIQKEFNKSKSVDALNNSSYIETVKIDLESGIKRNYKLTSTTKFEFFADYLTSELRVLDLLYVIDSKVKPGRDLDEYTREKHKYTVRDIIINRIDASYHTKLMHIKDPSE